MECVTKVPAFVLHRTLPLGLNLDLTPPPKKPGLNLGLYRQNFGVV